MRDRVKGNGKIGDDPRTIVPRDLAVHLGAVCGLDPFSLDALRRCADLALWFKTDTLRLKAAMVDPCVCVEFAKALVDLASGVVRVTKASANALPSVASQMCVQ